LHGGMVVTKQVGVIIHVYAVGAVVVSAIELLILMMLLHSEILLVLLVLLIDQVAVIEM